MMDTSNRRRVGVIGSGVVAGSVWESRMKSDEVKGGVKVFSGEENSDDGGGSTTRLKRNPIGGAVLSGKRKTWKSDSTATEGLQKGPIHIARGGKTEQMKHCGEQRCKELTLSSSDGIKKSPVQARKLKSEVERSPIQTRKLRSEAQNKNPSEVMLRKSKSDSIKTTNQSLKNVAGKDDSIQLRKSKSESDNVLDESRNGIDVGDGEGEKTPIENEENGSDDENCKDFDVCEEEKVIASSSDNVADVKSSPELSVKDDSDSDGVIDDEVEEDGDEEKEGEVEVDEEIDIEMENSTIDVKEISIPESNKVVNEPEQKVVLNEPEKVVVNEIKNRKVVGNEPEPKKVVSANRRFHQRNERLPLSVPLTVKQSPSMIRRHSTIYQNFSKSNSIPKAEEYHSFPHTQNKLQSVADLIMWRDISRSAFIFGIGTFIIVSSSYAKDVNLSVISVMSYVGLVYLALIFLHRSLICRGVIDVDDTNYVLGEEEAIWVLKLILPYLNEFLSRLKAMFSGDPGTTMKLAVLLFVLARCGSSITIWKMAKFGFFGVFTVPKICSAYSTHLTGYANFWIRRFRDAWDSCSHKKGVAFGIFVLVWNLSSVVARIWAVFVLFVAFRYYQQHYLVRDEWVEEEGGCDETWQEPIGVGVQRQGRAHNLVDKQKVKKGF